MLKCLEVLLCFTLSVGFPWTSNKIIQINQLNPGKYSDNQTAQQDEQQSKLPMESLCEKCLEKWDVFLFIHSS